MAVAVDKLVGCDDLTLASMLEAADPMTLIGLVYHATGDETVAAVPTADIQWPYSTVKSVIQPEGLAFLRGKALDLLRAYRDGTRQPPSTDVDERLYRAIRLATGGDIPDDAMQLHLDMLALDATPRGWGEVANPAAVAAFKVLVIGTGLAGVNAAIQLKASGIPFVMLDKNAGVGGTWFQNTYPGARVDWPSVLYSHSYGVNFPFRYAFAPQAHNAEYINWCVDTYGVREHIRFDTMVDAMDWEEEEGVWHVHTRHNDGSEQVLRANAVISAIGLLERPSIPAIKGMEEFEGRIFHTTRFDHSIDYSDKRVVVAGTGSSGMQLVPDLAPMAKHITVFQRTPSWVFPSAGYREELPASTIWLNAHIPFYSNWTRLVFSWNLGDHGLYDQFLIDPEWTAPESVNEGNHILREKLLAFLHQKLAGHPDLLEKCTPNYPPFGTRAVVDNGWFEALVRDNVSLVAAGITQFTKTGVIGSNGEEVPADVVILATGFRPNDYFTQIKVTGRNGVNINDVWRKDGPRAYWGVTVPYMPNLFILYGPNANPANLGPVQYGEWATKYFLTFFKAMVEDGIKSVEVREEAFDRFNEALDVRLSGLVSVSSRVPKSYYVNDFGRSAVQSPWKSSEVRVQFSRPDFENYLVEWVDETVEQKVASAPRS